MTELHWVVGLLGVMIGLLLGFIFFLVVNRRNP